MKQFFTTILLGISFFQAYSQNVGVGTASPDPNAQLDITSDSKGILIPRLTTGQRLGITTIPKGLILYDSTLNQILYHNGLSWQEIAPSTTLWKLTGNSGTASSDFIGTTDNKPLRFRINNLFAGSLDSATRNILLGLRAGVNGTTSFGNIVIGDAALVNANGLNNVVIGDSASSTGHGNYNTIVGARSGLNNTGSWTTIVGIDAGKSNTANGNVFVGSSAGELNTSGLANTFIGDNAGRNNTINGANTFLGYFAGWSNNGFRNTFLGTQSGLVNSGGVYNVFTGAGSGFKNTTGSYSTFTGTDAGHENTTGQRNVFSGAFAGYGNTTGSYNTYLGVDAGSWNTTGQGNVAIGSAALMRNGYSNQVAIGDSALYLNTSGTQNTAVGSKSLYNNATGTSNTAIGFRAGANKSEGSLSTFVGAFAGQNDASAASNIFIGHQAGMNNAGDFNLSIGNASAFNNTGTYNTFIGYSAGRDNTGLNNTSLGHFSLYTNTGGSSNTAIGYGSDVISGNLSNAAAIGSNAKIGVSNAISLGDSTKNTTVGIGTAYPTKAGLVVNQTVGGFVHAMFGSNTTGVAIESNWPGIGMNCYYNGGRKYIANGYAANINVDPGSGTLYIMMNASGTKDNLVTTAKGVLFLNGAGSTGAFVPSSDNVYTLGNAVNRWTTIYATNNIINTSDAREKKNIQPLQYGIEKVMQLKPVSFQWKNEEAGTQVMIGLLAQDVQKIIPEIVVDNNDKLGMRQSELIPVLIRSIQEQQAVIDKMDRRIQLLEEQNQILSKHIEKMKGN